MVANTILNNNFSSTVSDDVIASFFIGVKELDQNSTDEWDPTSIGTVVFDSKFEGLQTKSERDGLLALCSDLKQQKFAKSVECWIDNFYAWANDTVDDSNFESLLHEWIKTNERGAMALRENEVGILQGKVVYTKFTAHLNDLIKADRYDKKYPVYSSIIAWLKDVQTDYEDDTFPSSFKSIS